MVGWLIAGDCRWLEPQSRLGGLHRHRTLKVNGAGGRSWRRRRFTREFKVEAVKLVRERGVSVRQAARDLNVHENVLRKWMKEIGADPQHAFPGMVR